ncbi:hypothetical protein [uncultured Mobiluncus sp.]|uniref:hypothetical protein n=1 Tax=uncultured Mobiluncus sp. TaxID=293425 RepID=UPI002613AC24|nr:hypothetical protein [uncultured Mobiluncus sp.]
MLRVFQIRRVRKPVLGWVFVLLSAVVMSFAAPNVGQAVAGRAPGLSFASPVGGVTQDAGITVGRLLEGAKSDLPDDVRVWFATKAPALGQSLREYLPDSTKVPPEAQIEVGNPIQVVTWSARLLRGTYAPENAVTPIEMWVAPVSIDARELGVVVYTSDEKNLYPLSPPTRGAALAPKVPAGAPEPTSSSRENIQPSITGSVQEPKNSHLPIRLEDPGACYVLPDLAHALLATAPDSAHPNRPVYDPVIRGWFTLNEERLLPVSHAARARLGGEVNLDQVQEAVQSWWGTASPTPTPTSEALPTSNNTLVWVVILAVVIVGIALLVVWLTFRWQSRTEDAAEVLSLPDPELIMVPTPPPTSAIPTLAVSDSEGEAH